MIRTMSDWARAFLLAHSRRATKSRAVVVLLVLAMLGLASASAASAGDGTGFHWGSDGNAPVPSSSNGNCPSSGVPWLEPTVTNSGCGHYGAYIGEEGGYWDNTGALNCTGTDYWNTNGAADAYAMLLQGDGAGTNGYWFGAGPGQDPNYNGTTAQANSWGVVQAKKAWANWQTHDKLSGGGTGDVLFLDVEDPSLDNPPHMGDGWDETVNTSCSSENSSACCTFAVARATVDGFVNWIYNNTTAFSGIYAGPGEWSTIFGTGSSSDVSGEAMAWTADWTGNAGTCVNPGPPGWTQSPSPCSHSANFFGNISSSGNCAVAWQWSGGTNDYDQVNQSRLYACP